MVINHIYYDGRDIIRRPLGDYQGTIEYRISNGVLHTYWRGKSCKVKLQKGETYTVIINHSGFPEVKHGLPPGGAADTLAWLFGFASSNRTSDRGAFTDRLRKARLPFDQQPYVEYHIYSPAYDFAYCGVAFDQLTPSVAYIDHQTPVDAPLIERILSAYQRDISASQSPFLYPIAYVQKIFQQVFHLSPSDCDRILANYSDLPQ